MYKNVAVVFGGRSCEHDVSIITGVAVAAALPFRRYEVLPIYSVEGKFYYSKDFINIKNFPKPDLSRAKEVFFSAGNMYVNGFFKHKPIRIEAALIAMHGGEGENGEMQGYFEVARIPHTACPVAASAICMDKNLTKIMLRHLKIPAVRYIELRASEGGAENLAAAVEKKLPYPVIVKPALLGSSIGVTKCADRMELIDALALAARFSDGIIAEECLEDFIELNAAAARLDGEIAVSAIERVFAKEDILTFDDKYLSGAKTKTAGMERATREVPAVVSEETAEKIRFFTKKVYQYLNMAGVVRIDYLLAKSGKLYLNEINTVPGSLAYYLFDLPQGAFLDKLIKEAVNTAIAKKRYILKFETSVLR